MLLGLLDFSSRIRGEEQKIQFLRRTFVVYATIFIVWGTYRLLLRLPIILEEVVIKPLVFLPPAFSVVRREKLREGGMLRSFGFVRRGLYLSIYFGLTLGISYFLAVLLGGLIFSGDEIVRTLEFDIARLVTICFVSGATSLWEQFVFSGFFLQRFAKVFEDEWVSATLTAFLFTCLYLPIMLLTASPSMLFVAVQLVLIFLLGFGNSVLMLRTGNILAPILSHFFWATAMQLII